MIKTLLSTTLFIFSALSISAQCTITLDPMTVRVTQDSTIATNIGAGQHYLLCPGVTLTYEGSQSVEVVYYLEDGAKVISQRSHVAKLYMKRFSSIDANYSESGNWAITNDVWHDPSAIFEDYIEGSNFNECTEVVFNYGNIGSCGPASLDEIDQTDLLKIHPNPATDYVEVETGYEFHKTISILSVLGKEVKSLESNKATTKIAISDLKSGTYFVKISDQSGNQLTRKLVVRN